MPNQPPRRIRLAELSAVEVPAEDAACAVLCLHGYGADGADLSFLPGLLPLREPLRWIFPDAPRERPGGGLAWWELDEERVFAGAPEERVEELASARPEGLDGAAAAVTSLLEAAGLTWDRVVLGGFSQGAMLALELALQAPRPPKGLFLLSGALLDEKGLQARAPGKAGLRFFQSHGRQDPILSFRGARRLEAALQSAGWTGSLLDFDGGHEVRPVVLEGLRTYLGETLSLAQEPG